MKRRNFLLTSSVLLPVSALADTPKVQSLDDVLHWLDRLDQATTVRSTTDWKMKAVLEHLAQSIEMSMDGFPQAKPIWFQATVGAAAFAVFGVMGRMRHGLTEPIPGAPALTQHDDWKAGAQRLQKAVNRFQTHQGPLQPHFAYGALSKPDFARAHVYHVANHQDEIVVS